MTRALYYVTRESNEDRFGEVESLDEAMSIARQVAADGEPGDLISVEFGGLVVRQVVLTAKGLEELPVGEPTAEKRSRAG